ncbi:hypothetical protein BGZ65_006843 [Modicella reniformis]|uniref:Uncharacterized protein n=1 Tax=Modicella reniformis TaxID=1440133 RepID=A0A9P6MFJ2_9FUNG|nr:hypothetical protein BGZ65_006843 [Modicella reniformis]
MTLTVSQNGQEANLCALCRKVMHNHFPHVCAADMDSDAVNSRPEGSSQEEEHCWVDFEERNEKLVGGFPPKDPDHTPEVFPISPLLRKPEGAEDVEDDGRFKVSVHVEHDKKKQAQLEPEADQKE